MPINQQIWKIADTVTEILPTSLNSEKQLEDALEKNIEMINDSWLIIGRQVLTDFGHYIDLLAVSISGEIVIIELKRNKTPRDGVAQDCYR